MLPVFMEAGTILQKYQPEASFMIPAPSAEIAATVSRFLEKLGQGRSRWEVVTNQARQVMRTADAAMVSSGTATLETALMGCPMIIAYKMAPLSFFFVKRAVTVKHAGMVNIVAGRTLCPEFIQDAATPSAIADAINLILTNEKERGRMISGFGEVAATLGEGGSQERAAELVLKELA